MRRIIAYLVAIAALAMTALLAAPMAASAGVRPAPRATGSVALAGPAQYVTFSALGSGRYHGWVDYTNFTYAAPGSHVWNISKATSLTFAGTYAHTMKITRVIPLSNDTTRFIGFGHYTTDPSYTWVISGTVHRNMISFHILYTGTNRGYWINGHGLIAGNGLVTGTSVTSAHQTLAFTMPAGSAFQVLSYRATVLGAVVQRHNARFEFRIPGYAPTGLAGLPIVVKVHDGGVPGWRFDTYGAGVATSWLNGTVTQYPITSGNIVVHR